MKRSEKMLRSVLQNNVENVDKQMSTPVPVTKRQSPLTIEQHMVVNTFEKFGFTSDSLYQSTIKPSDLEPQILMSPCVALIHQETTTDESLNTVVDKTPPLISQSLQTEGFMFHDQYDSYQESNYMQTTTSIYQGNNKTNSQTEPLNDLTTVISPSNRGSGASVNNLPSVCHKTIPNSSPTASTNELPAVITVPETKQIKRQKRKESDIDEMENMGYLGDVLYQEDNLLFSHSTPLSVFTITVQEKGIDNLENFNTDFDEQLTPLFTPIPSIQPVSPSILETSNTTNQEQNESLQNDNWNRGQDDSDKDPDYVPSDIERQVIPTTSSAKPISHGTSSKSNTPTSVLMEPAVDPNSDNEVKTLRNKRKTSEKWIKNVRKIKRNKGLEYNATTGRLVTEKKCLTIDSTCCKQVCHSKIENEMKHDIFKSFWSIGDIERQRDFIAQNVTSNEPVLSRAANSRRKYTLKYGFMVNGSKISICKHFFLNTLNISEKMVRTALEKSRRGAGQIQSPDKRGKHPPKNKYDDDIVKFANDHIYLFPAVPSHWCRKDTKKIYLEPTLNKEKMFDLYTKHCKEHNIRSVCKTAYKELILGKNIGFHRPRKDQCWCHKYEQLSEEEKQKKLEEYEEHINRKDYAKAEKLADKLKAKIDNSLVVCTFDFEAVLYCPLVLGKPVFYKRKLGSMNFTIHNSATKQGYCYFWPEYEGNRGANEVATCLYDYITSLSNIEHLILYSDCCPGQNRNSIVVSMLSSVVSSQEKSIKVIDYKFLEPGHTYMECDSMHSTIETASEYAKIYVPDDWHNVIRLARKDKPYQIKIMNHNDFLDYKKIRETIIPTVIKSTDGSPLKWNNLRWLQVRKDQPESLFFKTDYWEEFREAKIKKPSRRSMAVSSIPQKIYSQQILIKLVKHKDLMEMCRDGTIPEQYHSFYKNLPVSRNHNNNESCEDVNDELALSVSKESFLKRRPRRIN